MVLKKAHSGHLIHQFTHAHREREKLTSSHSVSCNTSVTTLVSKCGSFNSTAYTKDIDAIREAETPIFEESAVESRQVVTVIKSNVYIAQYTSIYIMQWNDEYMYTITYHK